MDGKLYVDDGSSRPVMIDTTGMAGLPGDGNYVTVIGISSLYKSGGSHLPVVLPRVRQEILP